MVNGALRLVAARKREIASLLEQSYVCISDDPGWKTTAKRLREVPTRYLELLNQTPSRIPSEHMQRMMDWASWELARSALDESIKNSVGLLLYIDKIESLIADDKSLIIGSFDTKYISNFAPGVLYFCHLHSVLAGLAFSGFLIREAKFIARVSDCSPRWRCMNESWVEDNASEHRRRPHTTIFQEYDGIQSQQVKWLPERATNLNKLKKTREMMTYKMERMGGWQDTDPLVEVKDIIPNHVDFQGKIVDLVCSAVDGKQWTRTYDPSERAKPLRSRFNEYRDLAISITGP